MKQFKLPDLGEGLPDAEVHEWHVNVGDTVKKDDLMVSMETAKAVVDVPAPFAGTIAKLHGKPGDVIQVGSVLVEFADEGEATPTPTSETKKSEGDAGTVVGNISASGDVLTESAMGVGKVRERSIGLSVPPALRRYASEKNVDVTRLQGTGPGGRITKMDIDKASGTVVTAPTKTSTTAPAGYEALRGPRRAMALAMVKSHQEIVPVTLVDDADISAWPEKTDITARVLRAIVHACKIEPALNAWFDTASMSRKLMDEVNIGIAMDSQGDLFVPVIKNTQQKSAQDLREDINRYKTQMKDRSVAPSDLQGATISLSNFGTFAGRYANPIIVPPMVSILGTGRLRDEVVAINGKAAVHRVMPLSISIDHRAVTGGEAARFLAAVIEDLQKSE